MPFVPKTSAEFSGDVLEKDLSTGWARTFDLQITNQILSTAPLLPPWKGSVASIMRFSGRFFSHWQQDFLAVSVFTGRDFPAVSVARGRDFLAVSALTGCGIFQRYLLLLAGIFQP
jgi:hypothetical protein